MNTATTNNTITLSLSTMTLDEGIENVSTIVSTFKDVDSNRVRFNSATLGEIKKLRAAAICDYGRLQLMQGVDKDKEAEILMQLQVQESIIDVYNYLLELHNTTTTSNEEETNV